MMKTMLLAAAAALSLGASSAYAAESGNQAGGYVYPDYIFPGSVYAGVRVPASPVTTSHDGRAVHAYATHSQSQGTWLFPPTMYGGN
jgi:hypothetical protein